MKSTGVVRRIDELGRIVIPKEIRRNLGIRDGENVEIFTENNNIILKKYNRMNNNNDLAKNLCELVYTIFNYKIIITDNEKIICSSILKEDLEAAKLTDKLIKIIEERETKKEENSKLKINETELEGNFIYIPIISLNDAIGLVIMNSKELFTDEYNIGKLVSNILSHKLDI